MFYLFFSLIILALNQQNTFYFTFRPQQTIALGQIIYHRFYYKKNKDRIDFPPFHICMTCIYLACKIDEQPRRHRDVLTVFDRLYKKRNNLKMIHLRTIDPHGKVK